MNIPVADLLFNLSLMYISGAELLTMCHSPTVGLPRTHRTLAARFLSVNSSPTIHRLREKEPHPLYKEVSLKLGPGYCMQGYFCHRICFTNLFQYSSCRCMKKFILKNKIFFSLKKMWKKKPQYVTSLTNTGFNFHGLKIFYCFIRIWFEIHGFAFINYEYW